MSHGTTFLRKDDLNPIWDNVNFVHRCSQNTWYIEEHSIEDLFHLEEVVLKSSSEVYKYSTSQYLTGIPHSSFFPFLCSSSEAHTLHITNSFYAVMPDKVNVPVAQINFIHCQPPADKRENTQTLSQGKSKTLL